MEGSSAVLFVACGKFAGIEVERVGRREFGVQVANDTHSMARLKRPPRSRSFKAGREKVVLKKVISVKKEVKADKSSEALLIISLFERPRSVRQEAFPRDINADWLSLA